MGKVIFFNLIYMRGEKIRPNDGYESVNLSPAEKAGLKPGDVLDLEDKKADVVLLTKKKAKKEAVPPADDFSDEEVTGVYKKPLVTAEGYLTPEGHKDNSRKRVEKSWAEAKVKAEDNIAKENLAAEEKAYKRKTSQDTKDALSNIGVHVKETDDALELVRETAKQSKKAREIAEELDDIEVIRNSIKTSPAVEESEVKKLDEEIKAGFKNEDKQSVSRPKAKTVKENLGATREIKGESEKVKNAKAFAENAIRAYSKLYIEYDPNAISKIYDGKKDASDLVAALDLTAITAPPLRAIFSAKGRELRNFYGKVQEAIKKYNDEVEAS